MGAAPTSGLSNPFVAVSFALVGGLLPLLIGTLIPQLLRDTEDRKVKLFTGLSIGVLLSSFYDLAKGTSGLSGSTLRTSVDAVNILALCAGFLAFYGLHSRRNSKTSVSQSFTYFWAIVGIGFHSIGEGITVGYDFASGFTILSVPQAVSFSLHKAGEGFTIGTLLAISRRRLLHAISTSIAGGLPLTFGTLLGLTGLPGGVSTGFFATSVGTTVFLIFRFSTILGGTARLSVIGILLGFIYMYFSGVLHQFQ